MALPVAAAIVTDATARADGPCHASGCKIGEATDHSAIVWTRLTRRPERNPADGPMAKIDYAEEQTPVGRRERTVTGIVFPDGATAADLREAAPGVDGDVRVLYRAAGDNDWKQTDWRPVDPLRDFTRQFTLDGLEPNTRYDVKIESRSVQGTAGESLEARFTTAPRPDASTPLVFVAATCFGNYDQDSPEGFKIYAAMAKLEPRFFVHTGDIVYYDELAKTVDLARYHWQRTYSWPGTVSFHRRVASYFIKDDHDTWFNDCWPTLESPFMGEFTFRQGQAVFREQVPIGDAPYRTYRWGKDLQIWLVEGRDFRSPNDAPDGPEKTIWGAEQKEWFKRSLAESDATFRILVSPTPLVGPDRMNKRDNHANSGFQHEGRELREFLASQKNTLVICGDRHWQYMSVEPGIELREFSSGPASDEHAGGWSQEDYHPDRHRFLRVAGGFLSGTIAIDGGAPTLTMRFHDVDGKSMFEDRMQAQ